jgi:hypothetical protein
MSKQKYTAHINGDDIEYTVTDERDDGQDLGYYGVSEPQDGQWYGVTGPWPTESDAARRYEQQIIRKRGEDGP